MPYRTSSPFWLFASLSLVLCACGSSKKGGSPADGNAQNGNATLPGTVDSSSSVRITTQGPAAAADGRAQLTVVVTATGADNAPLANADVVFSADRYHTQFTSAHATTDANGVVTTQMLSTIAGPQKVTATLGTMVGTGTVNFGEAQACYGTLMLPAAPYPGIHDATSAVLVADFSGDGIDDVLLADSNMRVVYRYLGNGDGTFGPSAPTSIDPNGGAYYVAEDFNQDGHDDIVVSATAYGYAALHLSAGDGNFSAAQVTPIAGLSGAVFATDVDGDGDVDLLAPVDSNFVVTLLNDQNGHFSAAATFPAPNVQQIAAGKILASTGSSQDLLYVTSDANIVVAEYLGNGNFGVAATTSAVTSADALMLADINGDGNQDLLAVNAQKQQTYAYLGSGSGTFPANLTFAGKQTGPVTDWTGDGNVDLLLQTSGQFQVHAGSNDGNFTATGAAYPLTAALRASGVGDVNGDDLPDLLYAYGTVVGGFVPNEPSNNSLIIATSQPGVGLRSLGHQLLQYPTYDTPIMQAGDFSGDGHDDLLVFSQLNGGGVGLTALLGDKTGAFTAEAVSVGVKNPNAFAIGNFDGDTNGDLDLVVIGDSNQFIFAAGDGKGHLTAASNGNSTFRATAIVAGNFNADRATDVALAVPSASGATTNDVVVYISQQGNFPNGVALQANATSDALVAADLTGDGYTDLAIADPQNQNVLLFTGTGDGNFTGPVGVASNANALAGITVSYMMAFDVNEDGMNDLVTFGVPLSSSGAPPQASQLSVPTIAVWLNRGQGVFDVQASFGYNSAFSMGAPFLSDVNGDTHVDILQPDYGSHSIKLFFGHGDGTFSTQQEYGTDQFAPFSVVAGDYNGDGRIDLVSAGNTEVRYLPADLCSIAQPVSFERYGCSQAHVGGLMLLTTGIWVALRAWRRRAHPALSRA